MLYVYFEHLYLKRDNTSNLAIATQDYNHSKFRLGFASFLGDYTDLNVWLVAQFETHNDQQPIEATQVLRFYIKNILWEVGAGFDGTLKFNFMIHL